MRYLARFAACLILGAPLRAELDGQTQILLLGDSTTEGQIPKRLAPGEPQFEDIIRILLAAEGDLPPTHVINLGHSGEYIERLLKSGEYEREVAKLPGIDYILIRYGVNDAANIANFDVKFPVDYHQLLARLRKDHPQAVLIPMTVFPFDEDLPAGQASAGRINRLVSKVAADEKLEVIDVCPRFTAELAKAPNMLNYREYPLAKIPMKYRELVRPYVIEGKQPVVAVLDNRLDAHFGDLEGWFANRHPNLAAYHVLADEIARQLAPMMRKRTQERSR